MLHGPCIQGVSSGTGDVVEWRPMFIDKPSQSPAPEGVAASRSPRAVSWFTRLGPWSGGTLLALLAAGASAVMALALAELFAPLGRVALPLAAALGMLVMVLPLAALLLKMARQLERAQDLLARLDTLDTLTGVANRAHFMALADREWARARRYGNGAGILIIDIDRFRRLVEVRGNGAGDALVRELAELVGKTLRGADALARYGHSQLVVFLAHADATGALDAAERIRERVEQLEVTWQDYLLRATVSIGVATLRPAHTHLSVLMQDAEAALEASRQAGGNCVRAAPIDQVRERTPGPSVGDNQAAGPL